jgi:mannose-6-phosphate isomerase-like protein (cupin superfamily)
LTTKKLDLAAIGEGIDAPYRPVPLATLGLIDISLFICQGRSPWQRRYEMDELLFVLEGVVNVDAGKTRLVVNEGEVAAAPGAQAYAVHSGMRSTVVLFEDRALPAQSRNGHHPDLPSIPPAASKVNPGVECRRRPPFEWLPAGRAGDAAVTATRVRGRSLPYDTRFGPMALIVYRGVMDYVVDGRAGELVGSQMLVIPDATTLEVRSERGATLLVIAPSGVELPKSAEPGALPPEDAQEGPA